MRKTSKPHIRDNCTLENFRLYGNAQKKFIITVSIVIATYNTIIIAIYTSDGISDDESLFITEKHCCQDLMLGLGTPFPCGMVRNIWALESVV